MRSSRTRCSPRRRRRSCASTRTTGRRSRDFVGFAVRGLSKSYSGLPVLKDVDLVVEDGEIHALLGANGAGKSTLIKCVGGAIVPDAGEIAIDGRTFDSLTPKHARDVGVAVIYQ